jgi:hypothetical protein
MKIRLNGSDRSYLIYEIRELCLKQHPHRALRKHNNLTLYVSWSQLKKIKTNTLKNQYFLYAIIFWY